MKRKERTGEEGERQKTTGKNKNSERNYEIFVRKQRGNNTKDYTAISRLKTSYGQRIPCPSSLLF